MYDLPVGMELPRALDEVDAEYDMQAAARRQWEARAERMGLSKEEAEKAEVPLTEKESAVRFGITGGEPPAVT